MQRYHILIFCITCLILSESCQSDKNTTHSECNTIQVNEIAEEQAKELGQDLQKQSGSNNRSETEWFTENGLGLFIHWGIASVQAKGDMSWCMLANKTWYDGTVKPNDYYNSVKKWNPDKVNYDKMLAAAKAAGFGYAVLVTKHHDGFTLWPSEYGDIGTKYSFNGRDFVDEFISACRKYDLKVGLYYSPPDWWLERNYRNWSMGEQYLDMDHKPTQPRSHPDGFNQTLNTQVRGQVRELLSNYGKIDLMWFDGGDGKVISNEEVRSLQPSIVINSRNGAGDYGSSEGKLPSKRFTGWFEACVPCWPKRMWSYRKSSEYGGYDAAMTLTMLVIQRAWGGNLLANVGPKGNGEVPKYTYACWSEMAKWFKYNKESVVDVVSGSWPEQVNLPVTKQKNIAYIHFLPKLPEKLMDIPSQEKDFIYTRQVIPSLPTYTDTAIWRNAPVPTKITLLRTGEKIPFTYEHGTLTVIIPKHLRTKSVDVVKVETSIP